MITIIHGDDIVSSRKKLSELKTTKQKSLALETKTLSLEKIKQELEGGGLFGEDKIIVIENFLSSPNTEILLYLTHDTPDTDIVFWEEKNLTPTILNNFPKALVLQFKLKSMVFSFLESLRPGNRQTSLRLFHENLKNTEVEMIFYLLVRQFRHLLAATEREKIDEIKKLQPWQMERLKRQAAFFKPEELIALYQKLFEIEVGQKTGSASLSLVAALDLFLVNL